MQVVQAAFFFVVLLQGTVSMELPGMDSVIAIMFLVSTWLPFAGKDIHAQTHIFKDDAFFYPASLQNSPLAAHAFMLSVLTQTLIAGFVSSTHTKLNIQVEV